MLVEEALGGARGRRRIETIAMHEHEGDRALRQEPNFADLTRGGGPRDAYDRNGVLARMAGLGRSNSCMPYAAGQIHIPDGPRIGLEWNGDAVAAHCVDLKKGANLLGQVSSPAASKRQASIGAEDCQPPGRARTATAGFFSPFRREPSAGV